MGAGCEEHVNRTQPIWSHWINKYSLGIYWAGRALGGVLGEWIKENVIKGN